MDSDVVETLKNYITTQILKQPNRKLSPTEALITSGLIDSLHLVDLALFVEDTFSVAIDDTELNAETFNSLEELAGLIRQRSS
jgi:acyl carrier protein